MRTDRKFARKLRVMAVLGALFAVVALAACGDDDDDESGASADEVTIGFVTPSFEFPFYRDVAEGAEAEAENLPPNVSLRFESGDAPHTPEKYINLIDTVAASGVDAIAFDPYDAELLKPVIKRISSEGIPVVNTIAAPIEDSGETTNINTDTEAAVRAGMESMVEDMGGSGKVGLLTFPGNGVVSQRVDFAKEFLPELGAEVAAEAPIGPECLPVPSANAAQDLLQANPDLDAMFVPCGSPAIAAAKAVAQSGTEDLIVYSFDGLADEIKAIRDGELTGAIAQRPLEIGATTVQTLADIALGEEVPPIIPTGFDVVTAENADTYEVK